MLHLRWSMGLKIVTIQKNMCGCFCVEVLGQNCINMNCMKDTECQAFCLSFIWILLTKMWAGKGCNCAIVKSLWWIHFIHVNIFYSMFVKYKTKSSYVWTKWLSSILNHILKQKSPLDFFWNKGICCCSYFQNWIF